MSKQQGKYDLIRIWREGPFRLSVWDTGQRTGTGTHYRLAYKLRYAGKLVFRGEDFGCPQGESVDSDQSIAGLLKFLACRPGDTDREYFDDYSKHQLAFAEEHGEELWSLAESLETGVGRIRLERGDFGAWLLVDCTSGRELLFQQDWDLAPLASLFGWKPCRRCGATDGTVDCAHRSVAEMLEEAQDYLANHEGQTAPDTGYFECELERQD